jgi:hypothetical protein
MILGTSHINSNEVLHVLQVSLPVDVFDMYSSHGDLLLGLQRADMNVYRSGDISLPRR